MNEKINLKEYNVTQIIVKENEKKLFVFCSKYDDKLYKYLFNLFGVEDIGHKIIE